MHQGAPSVQIGEETPLQEDVVQMIEALDSHLGSLYPRGSDYLLSSDSLIGDNVKLLVARVDGQASGCGTLVLGQP